jgi:hypothetical protein
MAELARKSQTDAFRVVGERMERNIEDRAQENREDHTCLDLSEVS